MTDGRRRTEVDVADRAVDVWRAVLDLIEFVRIKRYGTNRVRSIVPLSDADDAKLLGFQRWS
ncbi:hypothetical protein D3C81_2166230 [compost metagenome]